MRKRNPSQDKPHTFEGHVKSLPISYQRLIGQVEYNKLPEMDNRPKALIIATDGTVKDGYGGTAVIIEDTKGNKLRSHLPADGNPEQMDSFRAELCGILAGLIILHVLAKISNKRRTYLK